MRQTGRGNLRQVWQAFMFNSRLIFHMSLAARLPVEVEPAVRTAHTVNFTWREPSLQRNEFFSALAAAALMER
jgi:hypothetical protein